MKATIDQNGTLLIYPESGMEAYALSHWTQANIRGPIALIVDASGFPPSFVGIDIDQVHRTANKPA